MRLADLLFQFLIFSTLSFCRVHGVPKFDPESPVHQDQAYDNALNLKKSRGLGPPRDRLSEAVHIHDVNMVISLINAYRDDVSIMGVPTLSLTRTDEIGRSPLHFCGLDPQTKSKPVVDVDCARIVNMLLEVGFEPNKKCNMGWSPLDTYATLGLPETVHVLATNKGTDLNAVDEKHGKTALIRANINGNYVSSKVLLEAGGDVNIEVKGGGNGLFWTVRNEVMRKISEGGEGGGGGEVGELDEYTEELVVDFNDILEEGLEGSKMNYDEQCSADRKSNKDKAVDLGCEPGKEYMKIIKLLLSQEDINVNSQDENGKTALVELLLETNKVNLQLVDKDGFGSITYARTEQIRNMIIEMLE
ncbi:hypothetical protein TrST_g10379 [Triparma strigata]|uniref:Uncharacterized protein n=1 Tax=Triparma strigata TaxID=1606541 RepID=A0A9W7F3D2_9STRA|nr:hypothetical protein TrST_g10379 [Triparma strigata]